MDQKKYNNLIAKPGFDKLLKLAQSKMEGLFQNNKNDINIARKLANIYRQRGLLEEAKFIYKEIISMDGVLEEDNYLKQIFHKEPLSIFKGDEISAAPFVIIDNFLKTEEQTIIWNTIDNFKSTFIDSELAKGGINKKHRNSKVLYRKDINPIASFFLPKVTTSIRNNFNHLLPDSFDITEKEIQLTLHTDGHFFSIHNDTGEKYDTRKITYVYYFNQSPKAYEGGDLILFDTNKKEDTYSNDYTRIITKNNLLILFPSYFYHQVTPVKMTKQDFKWGRFTLNGWFNG